MYVLMGALNEFSRSAAGVHATVMWEKSEKKANDRLGRI